jgi:hypothetical protein
MLTTFALAVCLGVIAYTLNDNEFAFASDNSLTPAHRAPKANITGAMDAAYGTPEREEEINARSLRFSEYQAKAAEQRARQLHTVARNTTVKELRGRLTDAKVAASDARARISELEASKEGLGQALLDEWTPKIAAAAALGAHCKRAVHHDYDNAATIAFDAKNRELKAARDKLRSIDNEINEINELLVERRKIVGEIALSQKVAASAAAETADFALAASEGVTALAIVGSHADGFATAASDVDAVAVYSEKTPAAVAAADAAVRRWAISRGVRNPVVEIHAAHRPFPGSGDPIMLIAGDIPVEQPDFTDPGTLLRAAAIATLRRLTVELVPVELIGQGRADVLANALAYCARRNINVACLTSFCGKPFVK